MDGASKVIAHSVAEIRCSAVLKLFILVPPLTACPLHPESGHAHACLDMSAKCQEETSRAYLPATMVAMSKPNALLRSLRKKPRAHQSHPFGFHCLDIAAFVRRLSLSRFG